jgi:hypothetical protein
VQAAATLTGTSALDVARAWGLDAGDVVAPDPAVDHVGIRGRYASARG